MTIRIKVKAQPAKMDKINKIRTVQGKSKPGQEPEIRQQQAEN